MADVIGLLGFGEAGQAICAGWAGAAGRPLVHDIKLTSPATQSGITAACAALGADPGPLSSLGQAGLVFCLVTADQAVAAARAAAPHLAPDCLWLDGNSCSPGAKRQAAEVIEAAGGRYVDLAIMAPIHPRLHRTAMLVSGPHAAAAQAALAPLGMVPALAGDRIGAASSIKMLRSVIVKGIEALTAESFLAARRAGVDAAVIASLQASDPGIDWLARGAYNLDRMMVHGARRAAEMAEVAATLRELGLPDRMAQATALWEAEIAALGLAPGEADFASRADRILARLE